MSELSKEHKEALRKTRKAFSEFDMRDRHLYEENLFQESYGYLKEDFNDFVQWIWPDKKETK